MSANFIGEPLKRLEGPLKVTGEAHYSAEMALPSLAYAVAVGSAISRGKIRSMDTAAAEKMPGVIAVITSDNRPALSETNEQVQGSARTEPHHPLTGKRIDYAGQYIAVVIAQTLENAQQAADMIKVDYEQEEPLVELSDKRAKRFTPETHLGQPVSKQRGDADKAFAASPVKLEVIYTTPVQNHNPMEPHATTADWNGDHLTIYDSSQWPAGVRRALASIFGIPEKNIRVISTFLGGAFGSKGNMWPHVPLAALASKVVRRPVKLVLARKQMFTNVGRRPCTYQRLAIGANSDGSLQAIIHDGSSDTSIEGEFVEQFTIQTPMLYQCPNVRVTQELVRLNRVLPTFMRAPGEATGTFGIECAMDELANKLGMDPIDLRMKNYAHIDQEMNAPFSSKSLQKCYKLGAEKFGWGARNPQPGRNRKNGCLIGHGMATAVRGAKHFNCGVKARLNRDGSFVFQSSTPEQGTGSWTIMPQIAAEALGVPITNVRFELGDTDFPAAPIAAGSATVMTVGNGVYMAAKHLQQELAAKLTAESGPFKAMPADALVFADGAVALKDGSRKFSYKQAVEALGLDHLEIVHHTNFNDRAVPFAMWGFGAHFAEVLIDPDLCVIRVPRFVAVVTCGRVMNERTCLAQVRSGVVWGISQCLLEETIADHRSGRIMNNNLAEYRIPVNADIHNIEAYIVPEADEHLGPLGAKGVGELGITGAAAAVANAVFNATGKRIRDLPITIEKLLV